MKYKLTSYFLSLFILLGCTQETANESNSSSSSEAQPVAMDLSIREAPAEAYVCFIAPLDGETLSNPVKIVFGLSGLGIAPALIDAPNTGHHHLLIDASLENYELPIPADENHVHFGLGQSETTIELSPGEHNLQLVVGDLLHRPHNPPIMSDIITIEVIE